MFKKNPVEALLIKKNQAIFKHPRKTVETVQLVAYRVFYT